MPNPNENGVTYIGKCNFRGNERVFGIKKNDRRQHMYVIGKTGVGKSALLKNMALQDIRAGRGIGIVDPHGEFVEDVLEQIPASRINDVVYFNPVDADYPIGFNILEVPDVRYKHLVVSDLLGIFTKIWANVWSARMEYILQNCILALIDTPGTTLLGIPRILVDKDYRDKIVANVTDPVVRSFWMQEYETWRDQFRNEAIVPIQNKVGQFLNTSFVRNIVGQPTSSLNIPEIMNTGKILLVNVSKGKIGEDNSALLGAMIITKIQLAAMERVRIPEEKRLDFYLYVDEFQNFATDSFAAILSEARKYRLNLFIAHQYVGQLVTDVSTKVRDAVFGNVGTMISFRVGATDAEFLEKEFEPEFMIQDLIGLPNYHIYLKLMVDGVTSRAFSAATLAPLKYETEANIRERIIDASRARYSRAREGVESQITEWSGVGGLQGGGQAGSRGEGQVRSQTSSSSTGTTAQMFDAQCFNCGKMTQVPFKPDGKRPVYCLQCLKQIEEGKLIPLPERMPSAARARYGSSLGDLGIEFESGRSVTKPMPKTEAPGMQVVRHSDIRSDELGPRRDTHLQGKRTASERVSEGRRQDSKMSESLVQGGREERRISSDRSHGQREQRPHAATPRSPVSPSRQNANTASAHLNNQNGNGQKEVQTLRGSFSRSPRPDSSSRQHVREEHRSMNMREKERMPSRDRMPIRSMPRSTENQPGQTEPVKGGFHSQPVVRTPEQHTKISLQSLKPLEQEMPLSETIIKKEAKEKLVSAVPRKEINTSDLRNILKQVLDEAKTQTAIPKPEQTLKVPPAPADHSANNKEKSTPGTPPSSSQVLKPGDTIKF